jgi:hypothetical protein
MTIKKRLGEYALCGLVSLTLLTPCALAFPQAAPEPANRIVPPIDPLHVVRLKGNIPARALPQYDQGLVDPSFKLNYMTLELKASSQQQQALAQLLKDQQNPSSPNYHKWLTPDEYGNRFGLSQSDAGAITDWLKQQGFTIVYVARGRNYIAFDGTAGQVQVTFQTEIHRFNIDGEQHFANVSDPAIPEALANVVLGIGGLHDFRPRPLLKKSASPQRDAATLAEGVQLLTLTPSLFASIYDVTPLYNAGFTGNGQKIVIVGQSEPDFPDIASFRNNFGLPANTPQAVLGGTDPGPKSVTSTDVVEQDLDLEWAGAVAPGATLIYVYSDSADTSLAFAIDHNLAPVMSESFGRCEASSDHSFLEPHLQESSSMGITVLASSGDSGAANCDKAFVTGAIATQGLAVSYPASSPEVTAVGGTAFTQPASAGYVAEATWNDTNLLGDSDVGLVASGGGVSSPFAKPSWQTGSNVPNDNFRDVPDLALAASPNVDPYSVVNNGKTVFIGGTSASSPAMAGIVALFNQYLIAKGTISVPGLGIINPDIYSLAQASPSGFHDITTGNNIVPCQIGTPNCSSGTMGYSATIGYDQTTGLGSIDAYNLALAWSNSPIVTVSVTTLSFANQPLGISSPSLMVTVTNADAMPANISSIAITGADSGDFSAAQSCPTVIAPGMSCTIGVTFEPAILGSLSASLIVTDNSLGGPQTVSLSGTGIPVSFSPVNSAFASEAIGVGATEVITITNVLSTSLSISSVGITGTNSSDFSGTTTCVGIISAGASCSITLTFTPAGTGTRVATLTINDNDGSQTSTLTGIGSAVLRFIPMAPCRIADTGNPSGTFGGPFLAAQSTRSFPIPSSGCGIPSTAAAYALNVTVVPHGTLGYISMWPTGQAQPLVSTLNSLDGRVKANAAIVPAGTSGSVSVYATDATDVILDINGYFVSSSTSGALAFYPLVPCRVADTRNASGALGGPSLVGSHARSFPVLSSTCGIPSSAQAYSLNFTAVPQGPLGYLSVWAAGQGQPLVSTLNAPTGTVTANGAIVLAGTNGAINAYVTNNTDLVIDINGYFALPGTGGLSLYTLPPCRVLDTRQNAGLLTGTLKVNVTESECGVPTSAQAYVFNATVVPPGPVGYLTLWPFGATQPEASTLNALDGSLTSNMAAVPAGSGSVNAYASNPTQLILDISGYFAP